jgi:hypothetical protein
MSTLIVQPQQTIRLVAAARGPKGDGANPTVTMTAGAAITVNQVLYKSNGYVYPASASVQDEALQVVGLATQSVILGASVVILITGERTDAALDFGVTQGILFLRENGAMSLTPPSSGVMLPVAKITGSTTIFFDTKTPIII